jgi:hypothetical protein
MQILSRCSICGRWPKLRKWTFPVDKMLVIQFALHCEDGNHECWTSFSDDCDKVVADWERITAEKECKIKGGS